MPPPVPPAPAAPPVELVVTDSSSSTADRVAQLELVVEKHEAAIMALNSELRALKDNQGLGDSAGESASSSGPGDFHLENVMHNV